MQYARRLSQSFPKRSSKVDIQPEKELFLRVVQDTKGKKLFLQYLQKINKMEQYYFYENVMTFKRTLKQLEEDKITVSPDKLRQASSRIIDSYVKDGASMFIPIDITCKLDILQRFESGEIKSDLFDEALDDHLMKLGNLISKEFMKSEEGQKYVDAQFSAFESF